MLYHDTDKCNTAAAAAATSLHHNNSEAHWQRSDLMQQCGKIIQTWAMFHPLLRVQGRHKKLWHAHTSSRVTSSTSYHSDWVNEYSHAFLSVSCQCWPTNEEQLACKNLIHKSKMLQISYTIAEKQLQYQHDDQCPVMAKYPHFSDHSHSQVVASLHILFK